MALSGVSIWMPLAGSGAAKSLPGVHEVPWPHPLGVEDPLPELATLLMPELAPLAPPELAALLGPVCPALQATRPIVDASAENQVRTSSLNLLARIMRAPLGADRFQPSSGWVPRKAIKTPLRSWQARARPQDDEAPHRCTRD